MTRRSTISISRLRKPGLGGKLGLDATRKLEPETTREWGRVLEMSAEVVGRSIKFGLNWAWE
ncbi:hypothetical protein F2981_28700 (plasmid) [Sinorhizobium meliloti]|nr:hypothetical protein [Sinorhizobium meliloti]